MANVFNKSPNFSKLKFGNLIKSTDNKYFVATFIENELGSEELVCQFGPKLIVKTDLQSSSTSIDCIIHDSIKEFLGECDDYILAYCKDNKAKLFNSEEISDSYLDNALFPSCKAMKKNSVAKFRTSSQMKIYDSSKNIIDFAQIEEGSKVSLIVNLAGIWFTKNRFGITWKVKQMKLHNEVSKSCGDYLFEDEEDEHDDLENVFPDE